MAQTRSARALNQRKNARKVGQFLLGICATGHNLLSLLSFYKLSPEFQPGGEATITSLIPHFRT